MAPWTSPGKLMSLSELLRSLPASREAHQATAYKIDYPRPRHALRQPAKCPLRQPRDSFVDTLVRRLASFDREARAAAKAQVNRFGTPTATELQSSNDLFFPLLALPGAEARRAKVRNIGCGVRSDFELNFGRYLPSFGRTDDTDTQRD
ncbi:MAG TPA: hypothetical protein VNB49_01935 [Candidatus Dormibacteraeota bacterium]|nr:hypothetical protein [Candidatus Dormibacteraeota bacterium]